MLAIAVVTAPRMEDYLATTLESIASTGVSKVTVFSGSPDYPQLLHRESAEVCVKLFDPDEPYSARWTILGVKARCAFAHRRALHLMCESDPAWQELLILEDDVRLSQGWYSYVLPILKQLRNQHGDRWLLTLYRIQEGTRQAYLDGGRYFRIAPPFWGTQGVIYPRTLAREIVRILDERCLQQFILPVDDTIGQYCADQGVSMYATAPSLVQHVGRLTTGQSLEFHVASFFLESVEHLSTPRI